MSIIRPGSAAGKNMGSTRFQTLLFDVGNTLCMVDMHAVAEILSDLGCDVTPQKLWEREPYARARIDTEETIRNHTDSTRWFVYVQYALEEVGIRDEALLPTALRRLRAYQDRHNLWTHVLPEVPPLLERLRREGYRLGVVSNSNGSVARKLEEVGLADFFDVICDSAVIGSEKPDPGIFRVALERMKAEPATTLHVGDLYYADCTGAIAAGITPVLIDPAGLHTDKDVRRIRVLSEISSLLETGNS